MIRSMHHSEPGLLAPGRPRPTPPDEVLAGLERVLRRVLELGPEDVEEGEDVDESGERPVAGYSPSLSRSRSGSGP